ncbi:unnamed protein product [Microthlaspi erraticum]|uniref:Retrovirus-related Pol polyprotein from transposon TNT 1-94-like beta-barrel domain-containing protein n=1 Tax=Microthlaspi erraticum TaxID=1685480 RepID=A0A6D2ILB0_9BRAS|nr:unnamed protein product [Microthlaspi erraticum]
MINGGRCRSRLFRQFVCLADEAMLQVEDLTTCKEIWEKLENMYMSKSSSSKLHLKQRLYGMKMSEGSDLMQHVTTSVIVQTRARTKEESLNVAQRDSDSGDSDLYAVMLGHHADSWVMDTCASFHMTSNREWFETYKEGNMGAVQLVDDRVCSIVGSNSIKFRMHDGVIRTLTDVRHVPAVKKNLISLGTLHRNGFRYHAVEGEDVLKRRSLIRQHGPLAHAHGAYWWHGLNELHKRGLLGGMKNCKMDFCKFCMMRKQSKMSFKTGLHTTKGLLDYVHFEMWRPTCEHLRHPKPG